MNTKMLISMVLVPLILIMEIIFENEFPDIEAIPYIGSVLILCSLVLFFYGAKELDEK